MSSGPNPQNVLFILSDQHNARMTGCYGHPIVQTPHIDALAVRGTRFASAYCNSPICVPSRASLATGRYVHEIGCWDNATPYRGSPQSWHGALRDRGIDVVSVGKLHYRGGDDYGFSEVLEPLHVVGGVGDLKGLFRKELPARAGTAALAADAGAGVNAYESYDTRIAATAKDWLMRRDRGKNRAPFALFVSFVMPHFPLIAPDAYYRHYERYDLEALRTGLDVPPASHPTLERMRSYFDYDAHFDDRQRAAALRAYFGMVSRLDDLVGALLGCLAETSFATTTRIVYCSDHGDCLGNRGMWGKSVMYDDAARVPMILAGEGIPSNRTVDTPVSLVDIAPTMHHALGASTAGRGYRGRSLIDIANGADPQRAVFSEYHAAGSDTGQFMVRRGRWKYVYYVGAPVQLFDLESDPEERMDLSRSLAHASVLQEMHQALLDICNPEDVDAAAFADQNALISAHGGRAEIERSDDIPFTPAPA